MEIARGSMSVVRFAVFAALPLFAVALAALMLRAAVFTTRVTTMHNVLAGA